MRRLVLLVLPLLAAGCVGASRPAAPLADSNWRLIAIDGQPAALLDQAGIAFTNETVSASVGCNRMGGAYHVDRQRLFAGPLVQTEMYCEGAVWGQEQALSALLAGAPQIDLSAERLTLVSSGHRAEFSRI